MIVFRSIHIDANDIISILLTGRVLVHHIYDTTLLYPFLCWRTIRSLSRLGFCSLCCNEHWNACMLLDHDFLQTYAQDWDCRVIWYLYFSFLKEPLQSQRLLTFHNKLWKILKEMGIPDHQNCLLRNLYAGQHATVRTGHGVTDWFQIGKGVRQGCILSLCLFNLYAEYIMRKAGLDEAQARIKMPWEISITSDT